MSYTRKVAFNTAAQMIGKVAGIAVSLVTTAAIFRAFGVEGVGKYTTVFAFVGFFSVFSDFGLQWTLIRELSINKDHNKVFKNIFTFRLILALFVHALAFASVWFFKYPIDVKLGVGVITVAWFFTTISSTVVGVFLNNYRLDITVTAEFIGRVVILAIVTFLTKNGAGLNLIFFAYLVGNIINFLINLVLVRRFVEVGFAFDKKYWRYAIRQAIPIGIVLVFGFIYYKVDSLMLSMMKGMIDVGIYGTAYKLLEVLQVVPSMFLGAAFPLVTKYAVTKDPRVTSAFQKQFDFLMLLAVPIVLVTFMLASGIIAFIAGSKGGEFVSASTISILGHPITSVICLKILIFSVGINFISNLYSYMIVSLGKQKSMVLPTILFALLNVCLNLLLIPRFSYFGAAIATLITEIVVSITTYAISKQFMVLPLEFLRFGKTILAGVFTAVLIYFESKWNFNLFIVLISAGCFYLALVIMFKAVPTDMLIKLIKKES